MWVYPLHRVCPAIEFLAIQSLHFISECSADKGKCLNEQCSLTISVFYNCLFKIIKVYFTWDMFVAILNSARSSSGFSCIQNFAGIELLLLCYSCSLNYYAANGTIWILTKLRSLLLRISHMSIMVKSQHQRWISRAILWHINKLSLCGMSVSICYTN